MSDLSPTDVAPAWVWLSTAASGVLAAGIHVAGGAAYESAVGVLTAGAVVGVLYLLYQWGQIREKPTSETSDREKEMQAEAGGYGGNSGGG
ncbi:uncharacterized protein HHUB_3469 [Halobacterium hubeiense]|jgi:O-antigen/teichoic acid export membrane protein|uniref:Uncharacterized protein n=1 Tax=Halobacterium hubeiense TaxID=1407499 RepID=A0A0U5H394_9EURY|nr:hypothetical protein [Halobacterium hubeiense]CQH61504.1 uncharacterized protein HHUB_3469 [Halobacterium hubeiense]